MARSLQINIWFRVQLSAVCARSRVQDIRYINFTKMSLEAIRYQNGKLEILDQLLLPGETKYITVNDTSEGWNVIKRMQVRGAPAIGIVGVLSLAVELHHGEFSSINELVDHVTSKLQYLVTARPTAVNMADSEKKLSSLVRRWAAEDEATVPVLKERLLKEIVAMKDEDVKTNKTMGSYGAEDILKVYKNRPVKILTHCNTGSLATAGFGTALGVVRELAARNRLIHCYCTETRPYNQGARLTAYELVHDQIPATLICDSMASMLMKDKKISAVAVGADRVVSNGDTANKIGTYQLAIVAKYHKVPFYVVAPSTSIDLKLKTGEEIDIEERPHEEMTSIKGIPIAAEGIGVWNPAFDVTPAELITGGIVTEFGVFKPAELEEKLTEALSSVQK